MYLETIVQGAAVVELSTADLKLLSEVFTSGKHIDEIADGRPVRLAALTSMGAAFKAAALACENLPETSLSGAL